MATYRNQLAEVLARVDQIAAEAEIRAAKVLADMDQLRVEVEGKLRSRH